MPVNSSYMMRCFLRKEERGREEKEGEKIKKEEEVKKREKG